MNGMMWSNQNQAQNNANNSMVVFVHDESMAVNYPVNPGTTVAVLLVDDPNNGKLYIKSAEQNGCPNPMRIFSLKDITPQKVSGDIVSRQEFDNVNKELQEIKSMLAGLKPQAQGGK